MELVGVHAHIGSQVFVVDSFIKAVEVLAGFFNPLGLPELCVGGGLGVPYVEGESVLMGLNKESALSSGSACTSSTLEPSYVIGALGASAELAHSSIRFSLHRFTTEEEVEHVGARTIDVVKRLREMSPLYELAKEGVDLKSIRWKAD